MIRFTLLFSIFPFIAQSQAWFRISDFPGQKRDDGVAVVVDNKAYAGTGLIEWTATADFYAFDLSYDSWSPIPDMPAGALRQYACAFPGPGCFYVFGGDGIGGALNSMYKYDIASSTWTAVASKPGNGLVGASCMSFGNKIIISGGKFQDGTSSAEVWEYNLSSDHWTQKNNVPFTPRWRAGATVFNNEGYLIFGRDNAGAYRKELYKYSTSTDNWTKVTDFPMPHGRAYATMLVAHNKLFVFGGQDTTGHFYKDIWYYNEPTNTWLQGPDLPAIGRRGGMSFSAGENFYYSCGLGEGDTRLTETWKTDIPVGLNKISSSNDLLVVYPNPTDGLLNVRQKTKISEVIKYACYDVMGRELISIRELRGQEAIDLRHLAAGVYYLKFYSENTPAVIQRIVKN